MRHDSGVPALGHAGTVPCRYQFVTNSGVPAVSLIATG